MSGCYPILLKTDGRKCVVVGGGEVAERKVRGLLEADSSVVVISPALNEGLGRLAKEGLIQVLLREYKNGDIEDKAILVFAATDRTEINMAVATEARQRGIPVNVADDPGNCDFFLPSTLRRGDLVIAVSTCGQSPALARKIREELEEFLPEEYAALCALLSDVRQELRRRGAAPAPHQWQSAIDADLRALLRQGLYGEARTRLLLGLEPQ
ncbi:MAG: bifunctional precorrin-2 dehydrogenase/sirohydrochlorin ferrochelatase [Chloroflexota bacterium]